MKSKLLLFRSTKTKGNNGEEPMELQVKAVLRAVKYKDVSVDAASREILRAIDEERSQLLDTVTQTLTDLHREVAWLKSVKK